MGEFSLERRSLVAGLAAFGLGPALLPARVSAQGTASAGYVLAPPAANISFTFAIPATSSSWPVPPRGRPISPSGPNKFLLARESRFTGIFRWTKPSTCWKAAGTFILNDVRHPLVKGGSIFIPKNAWHGFANPDQELLLLWIMTPAGLDGFFRETCNPPGVPPKQLSRDQVNEIARKYATEFR